jgi:hypothetical protein
MMAFVMPMIAQVDHDFNPNDKVPVTSQTLTKEQIPAAVMKAVNTQFDKNNPQTWSKFPFALKEYGWVYDVGASSLQLNRFEVTMKTTTGSDLWAVYDVDGNLIETREMSKNINIPRAIQEKLANSQYKDWTVVGSKEIIKYYHDHNAKNVEQHLRLTVEKDNVKRSISFNDQASINQ